MLVWVFTAIYYLIFHFFIFMVFRNFLSAETDILSIVCMVICFFISVGLGEYTVKKIKENHSKK